MSMPAIRDNTRSQHQSLDNTDANTEADDSEATFDELLGDDMTPFRDWNLEFRTPSGFLKFPYEPLAPPMSDFSRIVTKPTADTRFNKPGYEKIVSVVYYMGMKYIRFPSGLQVFSADGI